MIEEGKKEAMPLLSFDFYMDSFNSLIATLKAKTDLKELKSVLSQNTVRALEEEIHREKYDALVVTDHSQEIVWVSQGFYEMTGYSKRYAIGKKPNFLQGEDTSNQTRKRIRQQLNKEESFTETVVNYRKNGETYLCQIKVVPLYNEVNELTHYLAFEKELAA